MRDNFTLATPDAIVNIQSGLLQDTLLVQDFKKMMPNAETAETLWGHLVERISNIHGTELAAQIMTNLGELKRKTVSAKCAKRPESRTMNVKFEQLRAVKMQKRIKIRNESVVDLTKQDQDVDVVMTDWEVDFNSILGGDHG